ncbi:MAG: amidohydrolase [Candidatus Eisenbacteria bacterium]|uniref:Amidohydrolase n=1 Tax=Eiseniibacteriota bacterium TaxID=2212470 RepID=A0A948RVT2_UNCEI|nr:amidohydrolase [Candidatus Eisenbacteria bacterium]MBU1948062.1 amidohydrolase [Candidatus Eisenbacteria bacterium]MBU2689877.1 amidohydrolase [Candidatus Eisenbacteria bacterium]
MSDNDLIKLRQELHRRAETAHEEHRTASFITETLLRTKPAILHGKVGGRGIAAEYHSASRGPTVLLRCELDALPIPEQASIPYSSQNPGVSHKCGHDGHMAAMVGLANRLGAASPACGRVILLFQPAEETGEGAHLVLDDPVLKKLQPDWVFAFHNLPGYDLGKVIIRPGTFAYGSRGLAITLTGATAHAAEPEAGRSPALAMAQIIEGLSALSGAQTGPGEPALATVIHARLGVEAFGTTPGEGVVMVTLRGALEEDIDRLERTCRDLALRIAKAEGLDIDIEKREPFPATVNDSEAVQIVRNAALAAGLEVIELPHPFRWSEDFGHFTKLHRGALFGLGAGPDHPSLHHPDYDFPDKILGPAVAVLGGIVDRICG